MAHRSVLFPVLSSTRFLDSLHLYLYTSLASGCDPGGVFVQFWSRAALIGMTHHLVSDKIQRFRPNTKRFLLNKKEFASY